jgi:Mu-like prophage host-nuclease inhibitor protein Gam
MARVKSATMAISTIDEADAILREMCEIEASIEAIDNDANERIARIKEKAANDGKGLRDRYKACQESLKSYATYFRGEIFKDKKSLDRPFGTIGFRKAPDAISCSKNTAELLKKLGLDKFIRTKIEPDKEAMLSLPDETLLQVEAVRKSKEDFFIETKRELVNQTITRNIA